MVLLSSLLPIGDDGVVQKIAFPRMWNETKKRLSQLYKDFLYGGTSTSIDNCNRTITCI